RARTRSPQGRTASFPGHHRRRAGRHRATPRARGAAVRAPLVPIAVSFAVGVWLGLSVSPPGWVPGIGIGLGALALIAACRNHLPAASAAVLLLCAMAGWGRLGLADPLPATLGLKPGPASLEGIVSGDPETEGPRTRLPFLLLGVVTEHGLAPASGSLLV